MLREALVKVCNTCTDNLFPQHCVSVMPVLKYAEGPQS